MDEKAQMNIAKWEGEVKTLEKIKRQLKKYQKLKTEKAELEEIHKVGNKIAMLVEEDKWAKLDWKEIKRSKKNLEEGLEKIDGKIVTRKKKIEKADKARDSVQENLAEEKAAVKAKKREEHIRREGAKELSKEEKACHISSHYYHWAFGAMEVVAMENNYIYLRMLNKKGCKPEWINRNDVKYEIAGKKEVLKEFSLNSIGKWLFAKDSDVKIVNEDSAHKYFTDK